MYSRSYSYTTREAESGKIRHSRTLKLDLATDSFRSRSINFYNLLPAEIRNLDDLKVFKLASKNWIQKNVE